MERSRRGFLKLAGMGVVGLGAKPVLSAVSIGGSPSPKIVQSDKALTANQWAMVIRLPGS